MTWTARLALSILVALGTLSVVVQGGAGPWESAEQMENFMKCFSVSLDKTVIMDQDDKTTIDLLSDSLEMAVERMANSPRGINKRGMEAMNMAMVTGVVEMLKDKGVDAQGITSAIENAMAEAFLQTTGSVDGSIMSEISKLVQIFAGDSSGSAVAVSSSSSGASSNGYGGQYGSGIQTSSFQGPESYSASASSYASGGSPQGQWNIGPIGPEESSFQYSVSVNSISESTGDYGRQYGGEIYGQAYGPERDGTAVAVALAGSGPGGRRGYGGQVGDGAAAAAAAGDGSGGQGGYNRGYGGQGGDGSAAAAAAAAGSGPGGQRGYGGQGGDGGAAAAAAGDGSGGQGGYNRGYGGQLGDGAEAAAVAAAGGSGMDGQGYADQDVDAVASAFAVSEREGQGPLGGRREIYKKYVIRRRGGPGYEESSSSATAAASGSGGRGGYGDESSGPRNGGTSSVAVSSAASRILTPSSVSRISDASSVFSENGRGNAAAFSNVYNSMVYDISASNTSASECDIQMQALLEIFSAMLMNVYGMNSQESADFVSGCFNY